MLLHEHSRVPHRVLRSHKGLEGRDERSRPKGIEADDGVTRVKVDLLRLEYLARLSDISARKHQHVISFFGSVVATVVEALQSGLEALGDVSPVVGDVSRAADEQQSELERQQMMRLQVILGECREKTEPLSNHSIELADTFPHSSLPRTSKSTRPCCPRRCPRRGQEAAAMARACATK